MSEALGKWIVDIEARMDRFESDVGRAARLAERRAKEMQSAFEGAAKNILGKFGGLAAGLGVGVGAGAFAGFIKSSIDAQDHADELAQKIGITTEAASRLSIAAKFSATDLGGVTAAMVRLTKSASEAAQGTAAPSNAFKTMGINVLDASGKIKSADVLLDEMGKKFAGWEDGVNKTAIALAVLGKSGADLVPMLNDWNGNVAEAIKLADEFGLTVSSKTGAAAAAFNDNLAKLGLVARGVGNQIASGLVPALNDLAVKAITFFRSSDWKQALTTIATGAKWVADNVGNIIAAVKLLGTVTLTVYTGSIIKSGLLFVANLAQQLGGINKLIVAQSEWGKATAASFQAAYKSVGALGIAFNLVGSAIVGWQIGTYLREQFRIVADAGDYLVYGLAQGWEEMKRAAALTWEAIKYTANGSIDAILESFASLIRWIAQSADIEVFGKRLFSGATDGLTKLADGMSAAITPVEDFKNAYAGIQAEYAKNSAANTAMLADLQSATSAQFAAKDSVKGTGDALSTLNDALKNGAPGLRDFSGQTKEAEKAADKLADMLAKGAEEIARMRGEMDPLSKIQQDYVGKIIAAQDAYAKEMEAAKASHASLEEVAAIKSELITKTGLAQQAYAKETAELFKQVDVVNQYITATKREISELGMTDRQKATAEAIARATEQWNQNTRALEANGQSVTEWARANGAIDPTSEAGRKAIEQASNALYDQRQAFEASQRSAEQWAEYLKDGVRGVSEAISDFAFGNIRKFSDFGRSLVDIAAQTVKRIIAQFLEMRVVGPIFSQILGGLFGGGAAGGGGWVQAGLGLVTGGGSGGALDFTSTAGGATSNSILSGGSWITAGKNLWNGFSTGLSNFWSGTGGGFNWSQLSSQGFEAANLNNLNMASAYGAPNVGAPYGGSALGQGLGIAGGIYAGYNRFQNRYDTGTGLLGGAAYGIGTYAVGAGLASAAAGTGFASIAGMGALGPIGWVAAAAMLVDMLSGGSLFGTGANKFVRGESDLKIGPDGASVAIGADYKGRKPLFGGSYHEWKTMTPTAEQTEAANAFYQSLLEGSTAFAKQFGQSVGIVASGTFRQEFDKKGNITSTTSFVNGQEYKGETQEQFAQRLQAESYIATLKAVGVDITTYTQKFIRDAEAYSAAVQDASLAMQLAQQDNKAGVDVSGGKGLQGSFDLTTKYQGTGDSLADTYQRLSQETMDLRDGITLLTGQKTIESIEAFIRESQKVGETLSQTYVRLQQATASYRQFIGQFEAQPTYVDDFEAALAGVHDQLLANIKTANDLAKAAGLAGASTDDLAKITAYAAKQQAALIQQLEASAKERAYSMGLIGAYTLDQVNAEIADLEGRANTGTSAMQSFGRSIGDVARRATDAMNLLLGDLSPLNDAQKLQTALQGLRAGTVTQEQVLQIGRRLYASSEAYNQLFRQVQQFAPSGVSSVASNASYGPSAAPSGGLSAADRKRLEELRAQQATLLAAQDYGNAQTLARQIAEIEMSTGKSLDQILEEWGATSDDLAKRLKLDNEEQLRAYIENEKTKVDSEGNNTKSIVDKLQEILLAILRQGTDFQSPGGRNSRTGEMAMDEPQDKPLERLNRNMDRLIVPPSRNRRAPGIPYR